MTTHASTQLPAASSRSRRRAVAANLIGTVLEWYDFYVFGTATALAFAPLFFPSESPLAGTLAAFATYAIGFVFRPVAGMVIARWGDTLKDDQRSGLEFVHDECGAHLDAVVRCAEGHDTDLADSAVRFKDEGVAIRYRNSRRRTMKSGRARG